MNERLRQWGARIDAFYHCPHHPDITGPCECRKPRPGLIEKAVFDYNEYDEEQLEQIQIQLGEKPTTRKGKKFLEELEKASRAIGWVDVCKE